jgi:hypothetical protein
MPLDPAASAGLEKIISDCDDTLRRLRGIDPAKRWGAPDGTAGYGVAGWLAGLYQDATLLDVPEPTPGAPPLLPLDLPWVTTPMAVGQAVAWVKQLRGWARSQLAAAEPPNVVEPVTAQEQKAEEVPSSLTFWPGGFVYRGREFTLKGKPLQVLRAVAEAPGRTCTAKRLLDEFWAENPIEEDTLRSHVGAVRKALREAMKEVGVQGPDDPFPTVDRGSGRLAWRLILP